MLQVLGPILVPVPGVPRSVVDTLPAVTRGLKVYAALFQALSTNTGKVYIGLATLNRGTLAGVAAVLPVPTANFLPSFGISLTIAPAGVDLASLYLDVDNGGEGALLTLLVT